MKHILEFLQIENSEFAHFNSSDIVELRNSTLEMIVDSINYFWEVDALTEYDTLEDMVEDNLNDAHFGYFFSWLKDKGLDMLEDSMSRIPHKNKSSGFFYHWNNILVMTLNDAHSKEEVIDGIVDFINALESFVNSETSCSHCNNTEKNTGNGLCAENKVRLEKKDNMNIYQSKTEELKSIDNHMTQLKKEWKELEAKKESLQKEVWWTNHNYSLELRSGLVLECNMHTWEVAKNKLNDGDLNFPYFLLNYDGFTIEDAKNIVEYINKVLDYLES